ncbi:glycoside hydrolase family protein [Erwinia sp. E602]|uniref:glycoside hydrolase family protein n=1 Tax=Erwinia sp. E602 TaxID=2675378 RepID=UPI001BACFC1C|nr:glycoside hydrolase family protein [Erwinia sp. E602]QUG75853.1 glycoside hydrolase family protein [Erwinia sp. E602]
MELINRLKQYEGTQTYQKSIGYFRNDKFYPYKDSLGYKTVGYGHLITPYENFDDGMTPVEAEALLREDIRIARNQYRTLGLNLPKDWEEFMIIMIFQLGLMGVKRFRKMLAALAVQDWKEAIRQAKDSLWYEQTPNRLNDMISYISNK